MFFFHVPLVSYKSLGKLITSKLNKKWNLAAACRSSQRCSSLSLLRKMVFVGKPYLRTTHSSAWSTIRFNQLIDSANWKLKPTTLIPGWQSPLNVFCCCCTITIIFYHRLLFLSRNQGWNRAGHLSGAKNRDKTVFYIFFSL